MDSRKLVPTGSQRDGLTRTPSPLPPASSSPPPLNLKVMRLSKPSFSHTSHPFFEFDTNPPTPTPISSSSTSSALLSRAHSSLLQVGAFPPPLPTELAPAHTFFPSSMIDFPISSLLALPGSFGTICLGEVFTSSINVSNDEQFGVEGARLRVEIQATNAKVLLEEVVAKGGKEGEALLGSGEALSAVVKWEIKELGMHMLVCEVRWRELGAERSFRKVYKFQVTNPLSVKTKVHLPSTPSTTLSPSLRSLIFLELHIQNTSPLPLFFSKMLFEPSQGLTFKSLNTVLDDSNADLFAETPLLNPGDTRQVCFSIDEDGRPGGKIVGKDGRGRLKRVWDGGTVLPLGRMDINWLSPNGEPGRLVTSTLHRRVPLPPPPPQPSLPHSSSASSHLVASSLSRSASLTSFPTARPAHGLPPHSLPPTPPPPPPPPKDDGPSASVFNEHWEMELVVLDRPETTDEDSKVEEIFERTIRLSVLVPPTLEAAGGGNRRIELRFLPPPQQLTSQVVLALGPSMLVWEVEVGGKTAEADATGGEEGEGAKEEGPTVLEMEWTLEYLALEEGLSSLGGVRAVVVVEGSEREVRRWEGLGEVWVGR